MKMPLEIFRMSFVLYPNGAFNIALIWKNIVRATAIMATDTTCCNTISILPYHERIRRLNEPRTISMGFAREMTIAGAMPDSRPMIATPAMTSSANTVLISFHTEKSYSRSLDAYGDKASAIIMANMVDAAANMVASSIILEMIPCLLLPSSLRVAISLALLPDCATVKLI